MLSMVIFCFSINKTKNSNKGSKKCPHAHAKDKYMLLDLMQQTIVILLAPSGDDR